MKFHLFMKGVERVVMLTACVGGLVPIAFGLVTFNLSVAALGALLTLAGAVGVWINRKGF